MPNKIKIAIFTDVLKEGLDGVTHTLFNIIKHIPRDRFDFVFTPTHGSWLNIIESLFAKMTKTFLRGIRVDSKNEMKQRIRKWIEEINESPVVFRWKWKLDTISVH